MPIYTYECNLCGHQVDEYRAVNDRDREPRCDQECDGEDETVSMRRIVAAPMVMSDMQPYRSMIDGRMITSRSQHRDHLKAHGCIEVGNETKYLKPKEKIDLTPESKAARKQKIIEQVNHLKG